MLGKATKVLLSIALIAILSGLLVIWNLRSHSQSVHVTPLMLKMQEQTKIKPSQRWVPLDSISPEVIRAVIACEDNNFFYHHGFDVEAIKSAIERNKKSGKTYGASTITQQTAKNVFLSPNRTWARKAAELVVAVLIDAIWSKERILEVYLNVIEMGKNIYGVEAAAQHYFNKKAAALNKHEAVMIAISLPNPKVFNPAKPTAYMKRRCAQVYDVIDKLGGTGWYKNVKDLKQIKVNYLDNYPSNRALKQQKELNLDTLINYD
jgi:monofunctional biosynthetic peptidoglycan transglycosylase